MRDEPGVSAPSLRRLHPARRLAHERLAGVPEDAAWQQPLFALFEAQAAAAPGRAALHAGERVFSYGELHAQVLALAGRLQAAMPEGPRPVLVPARQGPAQLLAMLACLRIGAPYVPLDPTQSVLRNRHVAMLSAPVVVACLAPGRELAAMLAGEGPVVAIDGDGPSAELPPDLPGPERPAMVVFTSGSSGVPKGIVLSQGEIARACRAKALTYALGPDDVIAATSAPATIGMFINVLAPLLWGAEAVLIPEGSGVSSVVAAFARHRVTHYAAYVGFLRLMLEHEGAAEAFAAVRLLGLHGDKLSWPEVARVRRSLPPGTRLSHDYGMTECSWITGWILPAACDVSEGTVALGYAQPDLEVWLADAEEAADGGLSGTLCVALDRGHVGYWRDPRQEAARLRDHPDDPDRVLLLTGDVVALAPDGLFTFLGRADDQIKVRGWRVEPGEIEAAALRAPAVGAAGVVARRDDAGIVQAVALHVAPVAGRVIDEQKLAAHLRKVLPNTMWPAEIVVSETLPLTASHKIDRARLAERDASHLDRAAAAEPAAGGAWPDPLARRIAAVLARELEVPAVAEDANFGALGGDSLKALSAALHVEKVFGITIDPAVLLTAEPLGEVVADIAAQVREETAPG